MHNLTKIKSFRWALRITYLPSLLFFYPLAMFRKKNPSGIFFFFDRYGIGGAQKVHLDILESIKDKFKIVFFTRVSKNKGLQNLFFSQPNTEARDIHLWCDNLLFRLFSVHYFAFYVNRHRSARILSSNSTFFYDMLPFLKQSISKMELLHNFTKGDQGMEFFGLANCKYLDKRLVIDEATEKNIRYQYARFGIDPLYVQRIERIEFGVTIPDTLTKKYDLPLKVLYAGRGGQQKRVWLIDRIAQHMIENNDLAEFHFAGPISGELSETVRRRAHIHGEITDTETLNNLYRQCHVLLMTSAYEGFPVFVKEGMAYGCVPVVTALEGNKTHLRDGQNALLIEEVENEDKVVALGIERLTTLIKDTRLLRYLSGSAYTYAQTHFTKQLFIARYRNLLLG